MIGALASTYFTYLEYRERFAPTPPPPVEAVSISRPREQTFGPDRHLYIGPRPLGSFIFEAEVSLDDQSALEFTFHQKDRWQAQYYTFRMSSLEALPSGLAESTHVTFAPSVLSEDYVFIPQKWTSIRVEVQGAEVVASADGHPIDRTWAWNMKSGWVALAGLEGNVRVRNMSLRSLPWPSNSRHGAFALTLGFAFLAPILSWWLGAVILRWGSGRSLRRFMITEAMALSPLIILLLYLMVRKGEGAHFEGLVIALGAFMIGKTVSIFAGGKKQRVRGVLAASTLTALQAAMLGVLVAQSLRPDPVHQANAITYYQWKGERLAPGFVWYQHPLCRRWNGYLADRTFRGRKVSLAAKKDTVRILCLGTSSTWGHGYNSEDRVDYPARLEELLKQDGHRVEVLNAGIPGSNSCRLFQFFRDRLVSFRPDIVTISLRFNDAASLAQGDEHDYFAQIVGEDFKATPLHRATERLATREAQSLFAQAQADPQSVDYASWEQGKRAVSTFEKALSAFAEACTQHGIELVLIEEPLREEVVLSANLAKGMERVAKEKEILHVRPGLLLQESFSQGEELFLDVVHPNEKGHEIIARALREALLSSGWLEK